MQLLKLCWTKSIMLIFCRHLFPCLGSFPITLSKRAGTLLGGDNIIVSGLTLLREDDEIFCAFDKLEDEGLYISETQALCVTPAVKEEGYADFRLIIRRGNNNITGGALYQYSKSIQIVRCDIVLIVI